MRKAFVGYCDVKEIPIECGDIILIKKGINITSCNPSKPKHTSKKSYYVIVRSLGSGQTVTEVDYEKEYKYFYPNIIPFIKQENLNLNWVEKYYAIRNPTICWAGSGGYWYEADINDVMPEYVELLLTFMENDNEL